MTPNGATGTDEPPVTRDEAGAAGSDARRVVWIAVELIAGLLVFACVIGVITTGLRLAVAGLSPGHGLFVVPIWHSVLTGLIVTGIGCATVVISCGAAYLAAWRRWGYHGHDWQDIVEKGGVRKAWDSLHADGADGDQRRAARKA